MDLRSVVVLTINFIYEMVICYADPSSTFEFWCPRVDDVRKYKRVSVTWTLNNAIWLKVDRGNATIARRLNHLLIEPGANDAKNFYDIDASKMDNQAKQQYLAKRPLSFTAYANEGRYKFVYDAIKGQFWITIDSPDSKDEGLWQCHVTLYSINNRNVDELSTQQILKLTSSSSGSASSNADVESLSDDDSFSSSNHHQSRDPRKIVLFDDNDDSSGQSANDSADHYYHYHFSLRNNFAASWMIHLIFTYLIHAF